MTQSRNGAVRVHPIDWRRSMVLVALMALALWPPSLAAGDGASADSSTGGSAGASAGVAVSASGAHADAGAGAEAGAEAGATAGAAQDAASEAASAATHIAPSGAPATAPRATRASGGTHRRPHPRPAPSSEPSASGPGASAPGADGDDGDDTPGAGGDAGHGGPGGDASPGAPGASPAPPPPPPPASGPAPVPGRLTIELLFTNDIHGYIRSGPSGWGGCGAFANLVDDARRRAQADPTYDCVVLDAGDLFGGGAEDNLTRGKCTAEFVKGVHYDAYVLGNHDFGFGLDALTANLATIRAGGTAVLGANVLHKTDSTPATELASATCMLVKRGIKIGLVGLTTPGVDRMNLDEDVKDLAFAEPGPILEQRVKELAGAGADCVIALSHVGFDNGQYVDDKKLAGQVSGLTAIVGGHTHTVIKNAHVDPHTGCIVVQSGTALAYGGSLTLSFDAQTHHPVVDDKGHAVFSYKLTALRSVRGSHPVAEALRGRYFEPLSRQLGERVATTEVGLYRKFYKVESNIGDILADAFLAAAPGAQIAVAASSEVRADLYPGPIFVRDLFETVPFDNHVVKVTLKGSQVKAFMDDIYGSGRRFACIAGFHADIDSTRPEGQRVLKITVGSAPLDENADYVLATTDFVAEGKGGFKVFDKLPFTRTDVLNRDALRQLMQKMGTITPDRIDTRRQHDAYMFQEIGRTTLSLGSQVPSTTFNLYDLVTTAMLGQPARGDLALIDAGSVHWKLSPRYPIGRRDIYEVAPFDEPLVRVSMTGEHVLAAARSFVGSFEPGHSIMGDLAGGQLVIGGAGDVSVLLGGQPIDAARTYKVVVTQHLLTNPRGFAGFSELVAEREDLGTKLRDALEQYIKAATPIIDTTLGVMPRVVVGQASADREAGRVRRFRDVSGARHGHAPAPPPADPSSDATAAPPAAGPGPGLTR